MEIVAQVYDWKITKTELDFEENDIRNHYPEAEPAEIRTLALRQLIDRYLLMQEAIRCGICINDDELEDALLDMIDKIDDPNNPVLVNRTDRGKQLEMVVQSNLYINKLLSSLKNCDIVITDDRLFQFYQEMKDYFCRDEEVRASQILVKGRDTQARNTIDDIWASLSQKSDMKQLDFAKYPCRDIIHYGDLGYFPRGRMIPEIDKVAFDLQLNEISRPFLSSYGYHILIVTDRKDKQIIPFDEIKDCLSESLKEIEQEIELSRILQEIKQRDKNAVVISESAYL
jgi:hypothetical protein